MSMKTVTIPEKEYNQMKLELETLRNTRLYKRILEFDKNVEKKKFTRQDAGI